MKREDAERLLHHHYRLHTQVRSTIDNRPPKSMFISPKSSHYKPFATRKPKSLEGTPNPPRRRGQEELAHFLAHKHSASLKIPSSLNSSFNAYARKSMTNIASISTPSTSAASSRPSTSKNTRPLFDRNSIKAKILDTRTYQPPLHRSKPPTSHSMLELTRSMNGVSLRNGRGGIGGGGAGTRSLDFKQGLPSRLGHTRATTSATTNGRSASAMKNNMDLYRHKYKEFKEAVLSDILRRGVFTDRVIKDSFYREIERRTDLDLSQMEMIMFDTLTELGVKTAEKAPAPPPSRAKRPKTAKQRSIVIENGKVIQTRAPVVDFSAEPDMYIPDDKASQISSLPSDGTLSSAASSSGSGSGSDQEENVKNGKTNDSNSEDSKTSSSNSGSSESESDNSNPSPPSPEPPSLKLITRRTSSLPSDSSIEYLNPTNLAYRLSSSSEIEEHIRNRDKFDKMYNFQHYGRETSLDREESNNEDKNNTYLKV